MIETLLVVVHVVVAILLITVVLFQQGKGANIGATFGGSSQTMFGPRGPFQFLAKATTAIAVGFMLTSITLSVMGNDRRMESVIPASESAAPDSGELSTTLPDKNPAEEAGGPLAVESTMEEAGGPVEGPVDGPAEESAVDGPTGGK